MRNSRSRSARPWLVAVALASSLPAWGQADVPPFHTPADTSRLAAEENRVWLEAAEFDQALRRIGYVYRAPEVQAYLQDLANQLYPELAPAIRLRIGNDPVMNAFSLPNGTLFLNLGLLARLENEAQLVTVLAHEVVHFTHRHGYRQRTNLKDTTAFMTVVGVLGGAYGSLLGNLAGAASVFGYSRDLEREADSVGLERVVALGYDTKESARVFELLDEEAKILEISEPFVFATHPRLQERMESVAELRAKLQASGTQVTSEAFARHMAKVRADWLELELAHGRYKSLIHILSKPQRAALYPPNASFYLGEAYRLRAQDGDDKLAEAAYLNALSSAPAFAPTHRALGVLYYKRQNLADARRHFVRYLELAPEAKDAGFVRDYLRNPPPAPGEAASVSTSNEPPRNAP